MRQTIKGKIADLEARVLVLEELLSESVIHNNILKGYQEIGDFMGVTRQAASRFCSHYGLPHTLVSTCVYSTKLLIEAWVVENSVIKKFRHIRKAKKTRQFSTDFSTPPLPAKEAIPRPPSEVYPRCR